MSANFLTQEQVDNILRGMDRDFSPMTEKKLLLSNEELQRAITITIDLIRNSSSTTSYRKELEDHLKALLKAQTERAS